MTPAQDRISIRKALGKTANLGDTVELLPFASTSDCTTKDASDCLTGNGASLEPTKIAINRSRWDALVHSLVHVLPVLVTITVLCLNIFNVYWDDLGAPHQSAFIQAWQFAAKGHEILIVASFSAIVLHRVRYDLCASGGVPLGLVVAGYQLSSISYLWSSEFRAGSVAKPSSGRASQWPALGIMIGFAVALSAIAGPSSAIVMIPRLDWWDVPRHFFNTPDHTPNPYYLQGDSSTLWPQRLTVDMAPPGCQNGTASDPTVCPNQGFDNVRTWVGRHQNQGLQPNISIEDYSAIRYLTSSADVNITESGWTISSSVGIRDARDLGDYWDYAVSFGLDVAKISRPTLSPWITNGTGFQKPVVQVQCSAYYDAYSLREIEFPHDRLNSWPLESYQNASWTMSVNFSSSIRDSSSQTPLFNESFEGYEVQDEIYFEWIDMTNFNGAPALGALAVFWTGNGSTAVVPCTVDAHWAPVSIFLDPRYDGIIFQDSPDPSLLVSQDESSDSATTMQRISIDTDWAALLDTPFNGSFGNGTLFSTDIRALISGFGGSYGDGGFRIVGEGGESDQDTIPYRISTVLGMYLTEGLASLQISTSLVYHDYTNATYVLQMDDLDDGHFTYPGWPDLAFKDYVEIQGFAEVHITVQRYGYGWSFRHILIKLAAAVLVLHALIALSHVVAIVSGGWTCASWTSMGQMLVLALTSLPPTTLKNMSAGVKHSNTWKSIIVIRELRDTRLHLVVDDEDKSEADKMGIKPRMLRKYA